MKSVLVLCAIVALSSACTKLQKFQQCNMAKCACASGLSCMLTKTLEFQGQLIHIKQCMPAGEEIPTEHLTDKDVQETLKPGSTRAMTETAAFWYPGKECNTADDCIWPNTCCILKKRCSLKLPKYFTCYFTNVHKCGCMDGLTCKVTTHVKLPVVDLNFPIRQCVDPEATVAP
ncbi:uncharacterized protein LOC116602998 [Nematostella vectensis]|uniref:uncharacterized protein LOC116602998 n=1 Tax=Nematostella vectensis TaxID=45351 RepID=UPI00138FCEDC|nr:uncharacterized protein LOC116602998 [Nematostella vectensis]